MRRRSVSQPLPAPAADADWDTRFRRGDKDVIEAIYRQTFETVRRAAGRVLREPADRDGVVQQVYTELCSSRRLRDSYAGGDLGAWLAAMARHRAIDFARREQRLTDLSAVPEDPGPDPLADFRRELQQYADRLDGPRRQVLELRFIAGMTQVEAAAHLQMPRSTLEDWEREIKQGLARHLLGDEPPRGRKVTA
jgi:RNA polymerase sigma factor (sigma-70 family)